MQILPKDLSILAVDMPGNGYSSYFPSHTPYHVTEDVAGLRALLKHFNFKDPVRLLLHSYSIGTGFVYASAYPEVRLI
jgi:pimeloyl-ACP methyl ester carboxylesterase